MPRRTAEKPHRSSSYKIKIALICEIAWFSIRANNSTLWKVQSRLAPWKWPGKRGRTSGGGGRGVRSGRRPCASPADGHWVRQGIGVEAATTTATMSGCRGIIRFQRVGRMGCRRGLQTEWAGLGSEWDQPNGFSLSSFVRLHLDPAILSGPASDLNTNLSTGALSMSQPLGAGRRAATEVWK